MITVPQNVADIVNDSPYIGDALSRDLINVSALAREIRPQVETELMRRVSHASVVMALKRFEGQKTREVILHPAEFFGDMSIKSDLNGITIANSLKLSKKLVNIRASSNNTISSDYMTVVRGNWTTTIIFSDGLKEYIKKELEDVELLHEYDDASAVTLRYTELHNETPGMVQYPLQLIAWRGISLYQVVSTLDELTIIVRQDDIERCFQALRTLRQR